MGDVLFCLKIGESLISQGFDVYWPVIVPYSWLPSYIDTKIKIGQSVQDPDLFLDLENGGNEVPGVYFMYAKYAMVGLEYSDWSEYVHLVRNRQKEDKLYEKVVGSVSDYCLVSSTFASPPNTAEISFNSPTMLPTVQLSLIEGYTPIDWSLVIERASEIYWVDTCFTWIAEKLDLRAKKLYRLSRFFGHVDSYAEEQTRPLFRKPWIFAHSQKDLV